MAQEKGSVASCLRLLQHHVAPGKVRMMLAVPMDFEEVLIYRFGLIHEEAQHAIDLLEKIKKIAEEKGYEDISDALRKEVEFGHDFGDPDEE